MKIFAKYLENGKVIGSTAKVNNLEMDYTDNLLTTKVNPNRALRPVDPLWWLDSIGKEEMIEIEVEAVVLK